MADASLGLLPWTVGVWIKHQPYVGSLLRPDVVIVNVPGSTDYCLECQLSAVSCQRCQPHPHGESGSLKVQLRVRSWRTHEVMADGGLVVEGSPYVYGVLTCKLKCVRKPRTEL